MHNSWFSLCVAFGILVFGSWGGAHLNKIRANAELAPENNTRLRGAGRPRGLEWTRNRVSARVQKFNAGPLTQPQTPDSVSVSVSVAAAVAVSAASSSTRDLTQ